MHSKVRSRGRGFAGSFTTIVFTTLFSGAPIPLTDTLHALPGAAELASGEPSEEQHCRDLGAPVSLTLTADDANITAGTKTVIHANIEARRNLVDVMLSLRTEGPVLLQGIATIEVGEIAEGDTAEVEIPVEYTEPGRSVVRADLTAESGPEGEDGGGTGDGPVEGPFTVTAEQEAAAQHFEKHEALFMIIEDGRATSGMAEFLNLDLQRLAEDLENGLITEEDAKAAARSLSTPPGRLDTEPHPFVPPTEEQEELSAGLEPKEIPNEPFTPDDGPVIGVRDPNGGLPVVLALAGELASSDAPIRLASASGTVRVHGTVSWTDENGAVHRVFGMTVQVRDEELVGSELVAQVATDVNGQYDMTVNNDDGFLAGDRDIFVRFRTANSAVSLETAGIFGAAYEADTAVVNEVPDGSDLVRNFTCANTGTGPSCGLLTGATYVAAYAKQLNSGSFLSQIVLEWPGSAGSANYDGSDINLRPGDRWDWDVMFHEYGHYVMDTFDFEDNPGGPHNLGDCISNVQGSKDKGIRLAWGEGWPTFFGTAGQQQLNLASLGVPRVGDVSYADTGESNFSYSLETQDNLGLGEDNELAVQRILWDLFDAPADSRDTVQVTDQSLFDLFNAAGPTTFSGAWAAVRTGLSNQQDLAYGAITTDHRVGPNPQSPANNQIVGPAAATFSWAANVGCNLASFGGNDFDLVFYNAATLVKLLTLPGIAGTSRALTAGEFQTLVSSTHELRWAVEGRNTSSPASGPYLGDSRLVRLNRPPVADAGPDQLGLECTSPGGRSVMLNGTASSDPDNDVLTFAWAAPGIVFDNAASPTPTATFPLGTKIVSLTVSDGLESAGDSVTVEVVDTTPPTIVCPSPLSIECNAPGGVSAADPRIQAFLTAVSATDVCDLAPVLGNDAPGFFPLGPTVVTFTATDAIGNTAECQSTVTVVDTTPPVINLSLDRSVLWPPNHKLVVINADVTVTDICDPTPTFSLVSIKSSEPDNGLGDGDTVGDIQDAVIGTPDVRFKLRAERSGRGHGRIYSILYTARDVSMNLTDAAAKVSVPHNR